MPSDAPQRDRRIQEVDVLRGVCAFAVVLFHCIIRYDQVIGFDGIAHPPLNVPHLRMMGELPVYIFFVISGFVIYMTLDRCKDVWDFVVSRVSRIVPVYWVSVILTYALWELMPAFPYHLTLGEFALNFTLLQSFFYAPDVDGVYWSLAAELYFYIAMGLLFATGRLTDLRKVCAIWLAVAVTHAVMDDVMPIYSRIVMVLNLQFAPLFIAGICFYRLWSGRAAAPDRWLLGACTAALFIVYPPIVAAVMTAVFGLFLLMVAGRLGWIVNAPLTYLGTISYALYLTHQMIGYQIIAASPGPVALRITFAIAVTLGLASVMTFWVERPARAAIRAAYRTIRSRKPAAGRA